MILHWLLLLQLAPVCPVHGMYVSSEYGWRKHPISGRRRFHRGVDIAQFKGKPIMSMWPGEIRRQKRIGGYGRVVEVISGEFMVRYAHLSSALVRQKQRVLAGQKIGTIGESGYATGPHVHVEVWHRGRSLDPMVYLGMCR